MASERGSVKFPYRIAVQRDESRICLNVWKVEYRARCSHGAKVLTGYVINANSAEEAAMIEASRRHKSGPWIEVLSAEFFCTAEVNDDVYRWWKNDFERSHSVETSNVTNPKIRAAAPKKEGQ